MRLNGISLPKRFPSSGKQGQDAGITAQLVRFARADVAAALLDLDTQRTGLTREEAELRPWCSSSMA